MGGSPLTSRTERADERPRTPSRKRGGGKYKLTLILLPGVAWLFIFYLIPTLVMFRYSLLSNMPHIAPPTFTLSNYLDAFCTTLYAKVFLRTARFSTSVTAMLLLSCFPLAYYLAKKARHQKEILILLMIPFWTSQVLRAFAWIILLSRSGMVNVLLGRLHLIEEPLRLLYNWRAVTMGLFYSYIPYMILPLYAAIGRVDDALLEASSDLGANSWQTLWNVTIPLSLPGVVSGAALVFVASFTDVLSPTLLGGPSNEMISSVIFNTFTMGSNWPLGSALSFILFAVLLLAAALIMVISSRVRYET
jgi:spermidine/putrescine transport system permease protein